MLSLRPVKKLSTQSTSWPWASKPLAQMRAEKSGAAGDQNPFRDSAHVWRPLLIVIPAKAAIHGNRGATNWGLGAKASRTSRQFGNQAITRKPPGVPLARSAAGRLAGGRPML